MRKGQGQAAGWGHCFPFTMLDDRRDIRPVKNLCRLSIPKGSVLVQMEEDSGEEPAGK